MNKSLFFNSYKSNNSIKFYYLNDLNDNPSLFHFEIIEALSSCVLHAGKRIISLSPKDIVISKRFKNINIKSKATDTCLRHIGINLHYPTPLNQFLVADNPLIHDMMNDRNEKLTYIVFQNLSEGICHSYMDLLEKFASLDNNEYINFQAERVTGLLFTELLRDHRNKISKNQSSFPSTNVRYASKYTQSGLIMAYISDKNGNVTLQEVADHFGYQKNYLSRLCHKLFKHNFIQLRMIIRMKLACEQLKLTTKSVEEIGSELGYHDTSSFIQSFNDIEGLSPADYRHKNSIFNDL